MSSTKDSRVIVPDDFIMNKIFWVRGQKVMLDKDLSALYGVTTSNLNKSVRRNLDRFPEDFMFKLSHQEFQDLMFQNGISRWGGTRKPPLVFTELGVAMLSSVLSSARAIAVNIQIIRIFNKLNQLFKAHVDVLKKVEELEKQLTQNTDDIALIFKTIKKLLQTPNNQRNPIGFKRRNQE